MHINCTNCHRSYDVDDALAENLDQAACMCGVVLNLQPQLRGVARIGRYTLVNQIAVGGMGEIWFALQEGSDGFEKEVVVKRLLPNFAADRDVTAMLIKEAKVSSRLKHPNIVEVYDLVRQDGNYLIVMEYVPGVTVRDLVNACCRADVTPPWQLAVYIVLQLLRGLGYAHRLPQRDKSFLTFIHRDISPQNLLICQDGTVKITDFGIAKALNEASNTAPGLIRGKTSYLSPERVRGGDVNEASDLFPAAIILYEVWTLHSLFRAEKPEDTLRKLFETQVPALADHRQDVVPALEAVMRKALDRRASERYLSAQAFEAALLEACSPVTTEQIQAAASAFLWEHSAFFESVNQHKDIPTDGAGEARSTRHRFPKPPSIDTLLRIPRNAQGPAPQTYPPKAQSKGFKWWLPVAALGLFVLGFGTAFVLWGADLFPTDVPTDIPQELSAPKADAPSPDPPALPPSPILKLEEADTAVSPNAVSAPLLERNEVKASPLQANEPPRRRELHAFFSRHTPRLLACLKESHTAVDTEIEVEIAPSGELAVDVEGADLEASGHACLSKAFERLRFRTFVGAPVTYALPLHVKVDQP